MAEVTGTGGDETLVLGTIRAVGPPRQVRAAATDIRDLLAAHTRESALAMTCAKRGLVPDSDDYRQAVALIDCETDRALTGPAAQAIVTRVERAETELLTCVNFLDQAVAPVLRVIVALSANGGTVEQVVRLLDEANLGAQLDAIRTGVAARRLAAEAAQWTAPALLETRRALLGA